MEQQYGMFTSQGQLVVSLKFKLSAGDYRVQSIIPGILGQCLCDPGLSVHADATDYTATMDLSLVDTAWFAPGSSWARRTRHSGAWRTYPDLKSGRHRHRIQSQGFLACKGSVRALHRHPSLAGFCSALPFQHESVYCRISILEGTLRYKYGLGLLGRLDVHSSEVMLK
ncbi:uncharacterized protein BDV17DRAFT_135292 [Aspergillus undulatus]|uniref:uncharacterized protein n=1 Tax=Aspergillus undulatus TaxID=1810928 RepID=UPI003CCD660B